MATEREANLLAALLEMAAIVETHLTECPPTYVDALRVARGLAAAQRVIAGGEWQE